MRVIRSAAAGRRIWSSSQLGACDDVAQEGRQQRGAGRSKRRDARGSRLRDGVTGIAVPSPTARGAAVGQTDEPEREPGRVCRDRAG